MQNSEIIVARVALSLHHHQSPTNNNQTIRSLAIQSLHQTKKNAPKVPLGQPPHERPELVVSLGGQHWLSLPAFFDLVRHKVRFERGVEFGLEEGEEEIQQVDAEGVRDCEAKLVPSPRCMDREGQGQAGAEGRACAPMYQPCASRMRRKKTMRKTPVPIHLYIR